MNLCFAVHTLEKFSSNTGKVNFEVLVYLLRYIRENNNLGLKYYPKIYDAHLFGLLRKSRINTDNQFMMFSDSIWDHCTDNGISTGSYIVFYQRWNNLLLHTCLRSSFSNIVLKVNTIQHSLQ